ncbi:MAG: FtsX-like permease family protein [Clostridia bacterium]|nr:FtsX-like permease family protein [Clostridia bacterium]
MKKAMFKDMLMEIKNTYRRFISILLIILLGAGFFAGIKAICPDMKIAADNYLDESDFMDFKLLSTFGITEEDVKAIQKVDGVDQVMPSYSFDGIVEENEKEFVIKVMTLPFLNEEASYINKVELVNGRLPEKKDECVTEESFLKTSNLKIGDKLKISETGLEDTINDALTIKEYTIVGTVESPMYMTFNRGTTTLGSGRITAFVYIPEDTIDLDYYTEAFVTMDHAKELKCFEKEYEKLRDSQSEKLEELAKIRKNVRYDEIVNEAKAKIQEGQEELDSSKKEAEDKINDAQKQIEDAKTQINESEEALLVSENTANAEFANAQVTLDNAWNEYFAKENEYNESKVQAEATIGNVEASIIEGKQNIENLNSMIGLSNATIAAKKNAVITKQSQIAEYQAMLENASAEEAESIQNSISALENEVNTLNTEIAIESAKMTQLNKTVAEITAKINYATEQINTSRSELENARIMLENAKNELNKNTSEFANKKQTTYAQIEQGKQDIEDAKVEIEENERKLEEEKISAQEKIDEAQKELDEAKEELAEIKMPEWYVLDREKTESYVSYFQDADRVGAIAQVFPIIFFVVAALVSLTSMTRMVEEQRSQIGTLKALGYSKMQIASKYLLYAGIASIVGSIIGVMIGFDLLPRIIFNVYAIMYNMPDLVTDFHIGYATIAVLLSVLCTCVATFIACIQALRQVPAILMRPKAPKAGKRVFIEKIPFIWNKFNFSQKVTARNILRYKKRFFMTVIGIGGCTALLVAGFGLKDSVTSMVPLQYEDVFHYNLQIVYKDKASQDDKQEFENELVEKYGIEEFMEISQLAMKFEANDVSKDGMLIVPKDKDMISEYIHFRDRKSKEEYILDDESVIITEKIAKMLGVKKGDTVNIKNSDNEIVQVRVANITENYIIHYIYMSPTLYRNLYKEEPKYNNLIVKAKEESEEIQDSNIKDILKNDIVSSANYTEGLSKVYVDAMSSLNSVVLVLIVSAGALAFIVLYNLSNVNISERIRELATIKVLGFYDGEVSRYVYRENVVLTIIGIIVGLGMGYFLNVYIITTCEVDIVMFARKLAWYSYVLAALITIVFTVIVNIVTHFSLKKIDMIESLKSVE